MSLLVQILIGCAVVFAATYVLEVITTLANTRKPSDFLDWLSNLAQRFWFQIGIQFGNFCHFVSRFLHHFIDFLHSIWTSFVNLMNRMWTALIDLLRRIRWDVLITAFRALCTPIFNFAFSWSRFFLGYIYIGDQYPIIHNVGAIILVIIPVLIGTYFGIKR